MPKDKREYERRSGTGRGKEIAKDGAGGKFVWGKEGDEMVPVVPSKGDPNYVEEEDQQQKQPAK